MAAKMYVLISWPDGSRVINIENIKEPRKPFHLYAVGEQVLARCPGFSGLYWGMVEGISEHKNILEKKLHEDKEILDITEDQPAVQSLGPPQSKKSRKSFPKWNSGNSSRNYPSGKAKTTEEEREASCQQHIAPFLDPREEYSMGVMMKSHPSKPRSPRTSSSFNASLPFLAIPSTGSGTSQRSITRLTPANKDSAAIARKKRLDFLPAQGQKHIMISSEEKIDQLEQMVFSLHREVLSLKQKVQHLEAGSFKDQEPACRLHEASELFNGYARDQLKEAIRFDQKVSTACKTLLYKLFTSDYIQSHSITGRRGNTFREAKPMMDERCIKIIRILLKERFGEHLSDSVITEKIQNVQKALRQKFKMECA